MYVGLNLSMAAVNVVVVSGDGKPAARATAGVRPPSPGGGRYEQDFEEYASAALAVLRQAATRTDMSAVKAVGLAAQGGALQMLDFRDKPMGQVVTSRDERGREFIERLARLMGPAEMARHTGLARSDVSLAELLRLRAERPLVLGPPNRVGFLGDVLAARLCGRLAHDATTLAAAGLCNPRRGKVDRRILEELELGADRLPALLDVRAAAGRVKKAIARHWPLPAGVPVAPAVEERHAAALGCGARGAGDALLTLGGTWALLAMTDRLGEPLPGGAVGPSLLPGCFAHVLPLEAGASAVAWAFDQLGLRGTPPGDVARLVAAAGAGAGGLRFRPRGSEAGVDLPAAQPGRLVGPAAERQAGHVLRAVLEALAMELARRLRDLSAAGVKVSRLLLCGRSLAAPAVPQIVADVTGMPVACSADPDPAATGAATIARGLLERRTPLVDLARQMTVETQLVQPGPDAAKYAAMAQGKEEGRS